MHVICAKKKPWRRTKRPLGTPAAPPPSPATAPPSPVTPPQTGVAATWADQQEGENIPEALEDWEPASPLPPKASSSPRRPATPARARQLEREEQAEGGLWPVLLALVVSAVAGTAIGWWWLSRGGAPPSNSPTGLAPTPEASTSLPPGEVDQREQLISRLRALQIDRGWFLDVVNASLLAQYPERRGRLPSDSLEDAPLRKAWNGLAEDWMARVEQLPLAIRRRLGSFSAADWEERQKSLAQQGLSSEVLQQLVSGSAQNLLPGRSSGGMPEEPFRQLWYAAAVQTLENLSIEPIDARPQVTQLLAADVPANGARLFPIRLPVGHALVLGVNGTPLLQMSVYAADGRSLAPRGPLRVVNLGTQESSPVQLLVTNEGVAPSRISLSLRADPPPPAVEAPKPEQTEGSPPAEGTPAKPPEQVPGATTPTPTGPAPPAPLSPTTPPTTPSTTPPTTPSTSAPSPTPPLQAPPPVVPQPQQQNPPTP